MFRAVQMLAGFAANDPDGAMYLNVSLDGEGKTFDGSESLSDSFPKVDAVWSVTKYNPQYNLVDNPTDRYSLGDRRGMNVNPDGSLDTYVQKDSPGEEKKAHWLPAPDGNFFLILPTYWPGKDLVDQT